MSEPFKGTQRPQRLEADGAHMAARRFHVSREIDAIVAKDIELLDSIFVVIPLSPGNAAESPHREANRLRPAATAYDKTGTGARHVAIWLSVLHVSATRQATVYLVVPPNSA